LLLKSFATAVSVGSGFRGGLFFATLFMGALTGGLFAGLINMEFPAMQLDPQAYALVGMSGMAAAVIGCPFTMMFLTLEITGAFALIPLLVPSVLLSALTARRLFGYSFATWRFHLRGETIRSAHDIGWIRDLTVARLMQQNVRTIRDNITLADFRRKFPPGSADVVIVLDDSERYEGVISLNRAYAFEFDAAAAGTNLSHLVECKGRFLLPAMNVKEAVAEFERSEAEALAVVDSVSDLRVLGVLTEAHALRRYSEELDQRHRELAGETWRA
jgi:chloride channel protein, CIC family